MYQGQGILRLTRPVEGRNSPDFGRRGGPLWMLAVARHQGRISWVFHAPRRRLRAASGYRTREAKPAVAQVDPAACTAVDACGRHRKALASGSRGGPMVHRRRRTALCATAVATVTAPGPRL